MNGSGDVVGRIRVDPLLDGCREHERLERRPRLPARLREKVELVLRAVRDDGGHRTDRSRARADRDQSRSRIGRLVQRVADRLLGKPLVPRDDRRVHLEPAGANRLGSVHLDQLVADVAEEVRLPDPVVETSGVKRHLGVERLAVDARRDDAGVEHGLEHLVPTRERTARNGERVVDRRRLREARKKRGLRQVELAGGLREVGLGRRLDAVRVIAVVDLVEVLGQDPLLRPLAVELRGETRLLHLALNRLLARDVEVADELLRDRRPSFDDRPSLDVGNSCSRDSFEIDAAVIEEAAVLDRDGRLAHPQRHALRGDGLAVPLRRNRSEQRPIRGVDERVGADVDPPQRAEVAGRSVGEHRRSPTDAGCRCEREDGHHRHDRALPPSLATDRPLMPSPWTQRLGIERSAPAPRRAHGRMLAAVLLESS